MQPLSRRHWLGQLGIAAFSLGFREKNFLNRDSLYPDLIQLLDASQPRSLLQGRTLDLLPQPLHLYKSANATLVNITLPPQTRYDGGDSPLSGFLGPLWGCICSDYRLVSVDESALMPRARDYVRPSKSEVRILSPDGETSLSMLLPEQLSLAFSSFSNGTFVKINPSIVTLVNGTAGHARNQRFVSGFVDGTRVQYRLKCVSFPRWETAISVFI
jgi:hypothetical protein